MRLFKLKSLVAICLLWGIMGGTALAGWSFDVMLKEVDRKLPLLEKHAQVIVKMLNSKKHLLKIQKDINSKVKAKDTYLYRVLKKVGLPFEKALLGNKYVDKMTHASTSIYGLDIGVVFYVCMMGWNNIAQDSNVVGDESQAKRLINVCNRLMKIQKAVHLVAQKKLAPTKKSVSISSRFFSSRYDMRVYTFLFPFSDMFAHYLRHYFIKDRYEAYPTIYVENLKVIASFFDDFNVEYDVYGENWDDVHVNLDACLVRKAELESDFSDLMGDAPIEESTSSEGNDDLNLEDLKLPE